jgi:hypothetical protein
LIAYNNSTLRHSTVREVGRVDEKAAEEEYEAESFGLACCDFGVGVLVPEEGSEASDGFGIEAVVV